MLWKQGAGGLVEESGVKRATFHVEREWEPRFRMAVPAKRWICFAPCSAVCATPTCKVGLDSATCSGMLQGWVSRALRLRRHHHPLLVLGLLHLLGDVLLMCHAVCAALTGSTYSASSRPHPHWKGNSESLLSVSCPLMPSR